MRTYYEGIEGPVWVDHEERGPARVTSRLVIGDWHAVFDWPPGVTRSLQESAESRYVREFAESATRRLVAAAIAAGRLPAERCDHVGEGGLCKRRWTIEVKYHHVVLRRCAEHGHRFRYDPPGPSMLLDGRHYLSSSDPRGFERVGVRA